MINVKAKAGVFTDLYLHETMVDDCIHQTQSLLAMLRGWQAEPDWSTSEPAHVDAIRNEGIVITTIVCVNQNDFDIFSEQ